MSTTTPFLMPRDGTTADPTTWAWRPRPAAAMSVATFVEPTSIPTTMRSLGNGTSPSFLEAGDGSAVGTGVVVRAVR
jgi:hypothetical protein